MLRHDWMLAGICLAGAASKQMLGTLGVALKSKTGGEDQSSHLPPAKIADASSTRRTSAASCSGAKGLAMK